MTMAMTTAMHTAPLRLDDMATILVSGADARSYLQGQLSADVDQLTHTQALLACCNSAQGRVQAVLAVVARQDGIVLLVPTSMVDATLARLRKFVLRSKVTLASGAERLVVYGVGPDHVPPGLSGETTHLEVDGVSYVHWTRSRALLLAPPTFAGHSAADARRAWHLEDIGSGLPQVYPQTHEAFVAQMLNLDLIEAISFEKGCYTGQEIIARTHFRGAIKRRMFRYSASCSPPPPGTRVTSGGEHAGDVVDAERTPEGCELLAVVNLVQRGAALDVAGTRLLELPMPYEVT